MSTDPDGNDQWSRDLKLRTSAAGDTLPPVIVEGPVVVIRDVLAVVRFTTDVETKATVFFGTSGGTYGTPDEFEVVDRTFGAIRLERHGGQPPGAARLGRGSLLNAHPLLLFFFDRLSVEIERELTRLERRHRIHTPYHRRRLVFFPSTRLKLLTYRVERLEQST